MWAYATLAAIYSSTRPAWDGEHQGEANCRTRPLGEGACEEEALRLGATLDASAARNLAQTPRVRPLRVRACRLPIPAVRSPPKHLDPHVPRCGRDGTGSRSSASRRATEG